MENKEIIFKQLEAIQKEHGLDIIQEFIKNKTKKTKKTGIHQTNITLTMKNTKKVKEK